MEEKKSRRAFIKILAGLFIIIINSLFFVVHLVLAQPNIPSTNWPTANNTIRAVAQDANGITYIGGDFTTVTSSAGVGYARNRIAAFDSSGNVTSWDPNANSVVSSIVVNSNTVYVGGFFTTIGGASRSKIAALDITTGNATSWNPGADDVITAIVLLSGSSTIYVGGDFTSIGGQARNRIAALDSTTDTARSWNPNSNGSIIALALNGTTLYAGGIYGTIGGQTRSNLAALDIMVNSSMATNWNPNVGGSSIKAITIVSTTISSTVYVGGSFSSVGGQARNNIAALDANTNTNNATAWDPNADSTVNTMVISSSTMYVGGAFTSIGGQSRNQLAALNISTGNATNWNPSADNTINSITATTSKVFVGGSFTTMGGVSRNRFAAFTGPTVSLSTNTSTISESGGVATITATLSATTTDIVTTTLTFGGTAVNSTNYTRSSSTIVIIAGSTTGTITITGVNQGIYHSTNLYVTTSISSVTNAVVSSTASTVTTTLTNVNNAPPTTPTSTSNVTASSITYNWTWGGGPEVFYVLDKSTDGITFNNVATTTPTSTTNYTFSGLSPSTQYYFRVASGGNGFATSSYVTSSPTFTSAAASNSGSGPTGGSGPGGYTPPPPVPVVTTNPSNPTTLEQRQKLIEDYCPTINPGDELKVVGKPAIFVLGSDYYIRYFPNGTIYKTYKANYGGYIKITPECVTNALIPSPTMPTAINPRPGSVLLTFGSDTQNNYAILPNNTLAPISNSVATTLYTTKTTILNMDDRDMVQFTNQVPTLTEPTKVHPGMTIRIKNQDNTVYYVDTKNTLREVVPSAWEENFIQERFVYAVGEQTVRGLERGTSLNGREVKR